MSLVVCLYIQYVHHSLNVSRQTCGCSCGCPFFFLFCSAPFTLSCTSSHRVIIQCRLLLTLAHSKSTECTRNVPGMSYEKYFNPTSGQILVNFYYFDRNLPGLCQIPTRFLPDSYLFALKCQE